MPSSNVNITKETGPDRNLPEWPAKHYGAGQQIAAPRPSALEVVTHAPWQTITALCVFLLVCLLIVWRWRVVYCETAYEVCAAQADQVWTGLMAVGFVGSLSLAWYVFGRIRSTLSGAQAEAEQRRLVFDRFDNPVDVRVFTRPKLGERTAAAVQALARASDLERDIAESKRYNGVNVLTEGSNSEVRTDVGLPPKLEALPALPPPIVTLDSFPPSESSTAVPLGLDGTDPIRLDFGGDTLHVGLYGASGAGKDNLLRAWFMALTRRNTPDQVCFAVLDGKGDWLTADLRDLAHMWMPPAGGAGQAGAGLMKAGIERIEHELVRRLTLVNGAGCRTREAYMQKTGASMPLLVVFITDGVTAVEGALTGLMNDLVSKARAVGIRVVVSMQTPTGQDMRWRLNLSTYISGHLPHPSQDLVALGLTKGELGDDLRPSRLPTPQQEAGLFIVRQAQMVKRVKAVFVSDEVFDGYVARMARRAGPADPYADLKTALRTMDDLARLRELRRYALMRGPTRTGYKYTTDELRDLFGMQQNKLVAIVGAIRSAQNGHGAEVALR